jgi:hypothetical protein
VNAALALAVATLVAYGCSSNSTPDTTPTGMGGSPGSTVCTPGHPSAIGTLTQPFAVRALLSQGREYYVQVNHWNSNAPGDQAVDVGGNYFFKMTQQTASAATNGGPTGFPSIFTGANSGNYTDDSNMPKLVSALTTVSTSWTWDDHGTLSDGSTNSYNATYDVWFSTTSAGDPDVGKPSGGYLMVWYHKPADAQPIGGIAAHAVTIPGTPGTWDVWIGPNQGNGNKPVTSYVANSDLLTMTYDLNAFIKDATTRTYNGAPAISKYWYLSNVFAGFEIWRGGVGLETTSFCAQVN